MIYLNILKLHVEKCYIFWSSITFFCNKIVEYVPIICS